MTLRFADLFAGIGGFHLALSELGVECVFASEIDQNARKTYELNFKENSPRLFSSPNFAGDIRLVDKTKIPDFDLLTAGFPCQPFSQVGLRRGFNDIRGTLFFEIAEVIRTKQPQAYFLENVRHLRNHDGGRTFETIKNILTDELGYSFQEFVVKASDHGLPQHRPRIFMIGFRDNALSIQAPRTKPLSFNLSELLGGHVDKEVGFTLRVGGGGSGVGDRRNWNSYLVDGEERRLTVDQAKRMQGFPGDFVFPVSNTNAMKQLGNSVATWAVRDYARQIVTILQRPNQVHDLEDPNAHKSEAKVELPKLD